MKFKAAIIFLMLILFSEPVDAVSKKKRKQIMDSWLNATSHKLHLAWGPPDRETSDGNGGKILIYSEHFYINGYYIGDSYINPVEYYEHSMMYVNSEGIIYSWRWQRNPTPPARLQVDMNIKSDINIYTY